MRNGRGEGDLDDGPKLVQDRLVDHCIAESDYPASLS
jgi:hypothetical protein